ncbi:HNH endonuclease [Fibrobacter succinogenes]|uniref:HNH endonuclease n=1 Tax=Fibrobacter succinogenes TaxID=833 RepID=UPI001568F95C|nr:hypothetical protein [Fibrobacter succinogenes]
MIKIKLSEEIKNLHWEWYEYYLENKDIPLKDILPNGKKNVLSFIERFLGWDKSILKEIVLANPGILHFLAEKNNFFFEQYNYVKNILVKIQKRGWTESREWSVGQILKEYFGYGDFEGGSFQIKKDNGEVLEKKRWSAYEFTKQLHVDVCPYCGRQYIFTIGDGDGRPQLDHYFPQSDYPYLSCSLYNFIPSCPQCNQQKGDILNKYASKTEQTEHEEFKYDVDGRAFVLYPYEEAFECKDSDDDVEKKAWFHAFYGEINDETSIENSICVKIKRNNSLPQEMERKIENSIEAFHLNELYSCQQIELKDLFARYRYYCKPRIDEITKLILQAQLGGGNNDINNSIIVKAYTRRIKNIILGKPLNIRDKQYPLRKFKEDIIEQLDRTHKVMGK